MGNDLVEVFFVPAESDGKGCLQCLPGKKTMIAAERTDIVFRREYITSSGYLSGHRSAPLRSGKNPGGADCKGHSFRTAKPPTVPKEDRSRPGHTRHPRPIALHLHRIASTDPNLSLARKYHRAGKPCYTSGLSVWTIHGKTDAPDFQVRRAHTFPTHEQPDALGLPSGFL